MFRSKWRVKTGLFGAFVIPAFLAIEVFAATSDHYPVYVGLVR